MNSKTIPLIFTVSLVILISLAPSANALFLEWDGVIDELPDSGFDPLGQQWGYADDVWAIFGNWKGDDWITDFHIEFNGLDPETQIFSAFLTIFPDVEPFFIDWDCEIVDEIKVWCRAVDPITDRLNPGEFFELTVFLDTESEPSITFNAEWTMGEQMQPVGGELLSLNTTSLLLASAQTFSWMIPVILSVLGIGLFVASRKSENS